MLCSVHLQPYVCADALHTDALHTGAVHTDAHTCCAGVYTAGMTNKEQMHDGVRNVPSAIISC